MRVTTDGHCGAGGPQPGSELRRRERCRLDVPEGRERQQERSGKAEEEESPGAAARRRGEWLRTRRHHQPPVVSTLWHHQGHRHAAASRVCCLDPMDLMPPPTGLFPASRSPHPRRCERPQADVAHGKSVRDVEHPTLLRPDGRLLLLEHMRSPIAAVHAIQWVLEPFSVRAEADRLLREPLADVVAAGLQVEQLTRSRWGLVERVAAHKPDEAA